MRTEKTEFFELTWMTQEEFYGIDNKLSIKQIVNLDEKKAINYLKNNNTKQELFNQLNNWLDFYKSLVKQGINEKELDMKILAKFSSLLFNSIVNFN